MWLQEIGTLREAYEGYKKTRAILQVTKIKVAKKAVKKVAKKVKKKVVEKDNIKE